ncbi:MAG TPA: helix-turn-helix domain-containing protein [Candidatus Dormibacteraeota bacterium]|jgi:DNA-binding HxlR family transcriptional regulator|nr:helix-turn-helix domain-containing protein [Candidatus Dormibacteraeota bacterium]
MDWREQNPENCSVARTIEVIGERWTLLVLRELFNGVWRFDEMQRHLGIPRPILSDRLSRLVDAGVLGRREYREPGQRVRHEYRLTETGLALQTVVIALMEWGDRHRGGPGGPARTVHHRDCGAPVHVGLVCDAGHTLTSPRDVVGRRGPGARPLVASAAGS